MNFKQYIKKLRDSYVINHARRAKLPEFNPAPTIRKKVIFSGRVQNVGFRLETYELAKRLDLVGWVKNREDKKVEAELQGEYEKIIFLINHMKSLKRATVDDVEVQELVTLANETDFTLIKY